MASQESRYWDLHTCAWVRQQQGAVPGDPLPLPEQRDDSRVVDRTDDQVRVRG